MAFLYQQQHFTPEELSPMNQMVQNAMKNYSQALSLKYKPQQIEAEIFAKKFGPLAEFATSKLAEGLSPQQAAVARQLLMQQMTGMGQSGANNMNQEMHPFQALKNYFTKNQPQMSQFNMPNHVTEFMGNETPNQNGQGPGPGNATSYETQAGITAQQVGEGARYTDPITGEVKYAPSGTITQLADKSAAKYPETHGDLQKLIKSLEALQKKHPLGGRAMLLGERTQAPLLKALAPADIENLQKNIASNLHKFFDKDADSAFSSTQLGYKETIPEFINRLKTMDKNLGNYHQLLKNYKRSGISLEKEGNVNEESNEESVKKAEQSSDVLIEFGNGRSGYFSASKLKAIKDKYPDAKVVR